METLIFIAIAVVITIIQKKLEKAKEQQNQLPRHQEQHRENGEADDDTQEAEHQPPRSLQDLIRQFENAQRQATQGNIEPPTPPVERRDRNKPLTLRDIAEAVIEVDYIDLEFLMEEFDVDENTAAEMLMDLQDHRIVGRDMGEGECDVLVHDLEELDNLLLREKIAEQARKQKESQRQAQNDAEDEARRRELERQRELNSLEERAKSARESAAAIASMDPAEASAEGKPTVRKPLVSTRNLADVRKGFIWAKVLEEPRFKRRWSAQYR
jgi:hypothetical protein